MLAEALEKASVPEEGNKEHGKKDQALEKAPVVAEEGKKQEALEKATAVVPEQGITLTSAAPAASSVVPDGITLTPAPSTNKAALEKVTLKPAPGRRPVVVVDWHNSLEKEDTVPESHQEALEQLMQVADVHILSYVGTRNRMAQVHQDVKDMVRAMAQLAGVHTCWHKTGWQGKAAYCIWLKASAIFDDDEKICTECFGKGIETYALMSGSSSHNYLPSRRVFKDFPEAVAEYIDGLTWKLGKRFRWEEPGSFGKGLGCNYLAALEKAPPLKVLHKAARLQVPGGFGKGPTTESFGKGFQTKLCVSPKHVQT